MIGLFISTACIYQHRKLKNKHHLYTTFRRCVVVAILMIPVVQIFSGQTQTVNNP